MSMFRITDVTPAGAFVNAISVASEAETHAPRARADEPARVGERCSLVARVSAWIVRFATGLRAAIRMAPAETI